jgi:hypothetical protein
MDENSTRDAGKFIDTLDRIRDMFGSTVLTIHHTGHAARDRMRGSVAFKGAADFEYMLEPQGDDILVKTDHKTKDFEAPSPLTLVKRKIDLGLVNESGMPQFSLVLDCHSDTQEETEPDSDDLVTFLAYLNGRRKVSRKVWQADTLAGLTGPDRRKANAAFDRMVKRLVKNGEATLQGDILTPQTPR